MRTWFRVFADNSQESAKSQVFWIDSFFAGEDADFDMISLLAEGNCFRPAFCIWCSIPETVEYKSVGDGVEVYVNIGG